MPDIHHLLTIQAPVEKVFEGISRPEGLNIWWTQSSKGRPQLGEEYQFYFSDEYDWRAEVIKVFPPKMICWQMKIADEDWLPTRIQFDLEAEGEGTIIRFCHENWFTLNDHFRRSSYCWAMYLSGLKQYLE